MVNQLTIQIAAIMKEIANDEATAKCSINNEMKTCDSVDQI